MRKSLLIILILLTACSTKQDIYQNKVIIESIKINNEINISSIKEEVNGIVLFSEFGRPDIDKTNTVIGAHSGTGSNAYFNDLKSIEIGDIINISYENNYYEYIVIDNIIVDKQDLYILDDKEYSTLTLLTCDLDNLDKRIVIIAKLNK